MMAAELALRTGWPGAHFKSLTKRTSDLVLARIAAMPNGSFHRPSLCGSRILSTREGVFTLAWLPARDRRYEVRGWHGTFWGE
jgi:hypothetical protein